MNTKKIKITLISAVFVCLFLSGFTVKATPTIESMEFPESIKANETFEIKINWIYTSTSRCLYGNYVWIYYAVAVNPVLEYADATRRIAVNITGFIDFPNPRYTIIEIDMENLYCTPLEGDTFLFRIKYIVGVISGDDILESGTCYSECYEITPVKKANMSVVVIVAPLLILSAAVYIRKKKIELR